MPAARQWSTRVPGETPIYHYIMRNTANPDRGGEALGNILVAKFGGSVLRGARDYRRASGIVSDLLEHGFKPVVVVSALKGVTDLLISMAVEARGSSSAVRKIAGLHRGVIAEVADSPFFEEAYLEMSRLLDALAKTVWAVGVLGEATPRVRDYIVSFGEKFSAIIMEAALKTAGLDARWMSGGEAGVITDGNFGDATPILEEAVPRIRSRLLPMLDSGVVPVVTGFLGATRSGETTTLGRGGSDYSAALLGAALEAREVRLYTNVEGVLTANPELIPHARTIPRLAVEEAMELSYLGAKKFHPRTFEPLKMRGIPIRILSFHNPEGPSTLVEGHCSNGDGVKAVVVVEDLALVKVKGPTMVGRIGTAAEVMSLAREARVNISAISQPVSETVISIVVKQDDASRLARLVEERLKPRRVVESVEVVEPISALVVVGCGLRRSDVLSRVMGELSGVEVYMAARGLEGVSLTVLTEPSDAVAMAEKIHDEVILDGQA